MSKPIAIGATIAAFGVAMLGGLVFQKINTPQTPEQIQAKIEKGVAKVKPTLPKKVGPNVIWFDIQARFHKVIYKYKILASRDLILSRRKEVEREVRKQVSKAWWIWMTIPKGVRMAVHIHDRDGSFMFGFSMSRDDAAVK